MNYQQTAREFDALDERSEEISERLERLRKNLNTRSRGRSEYMNCWTRKKNSNRSGRSLSSVKRN